MALCVGFLLSHSQEQRGRTYIYNPYLRSTCAVTEFTDIRGYSNTSY